MGPRQTNRKPEMTETERDELVLQMAYEFEELADNARPYRGISASERRDLVKWLRQEFRRLAKYNGDKHGCVIVDRTRRVVRVRPQPAPHIDHRMSLPAVLRRPDTEAGLAMLGLSRLAYYATPSENNLAKYPEAAARLERKVRA